jgi:hypothetical protein
MVTFESDLSLEDIIIEMRKLGGAKVMYQTVQPVEN